MQRAPARDRGAKRSRRANRPLSQSTADRLEAGQILFDRYRLEREVGRGGVADVWRAHDERLDRTVAIKVLQPRLLPDETWRRRFVAEARAASGLTHPGIVPVHDVIDDPATPAIVFQFVEGETLAERLRRERAVPLPDVTRIAGQVAEALAHAHRAGVIHRDVKPANILLDAEDGRARLADFGIARVVDDARAELTGDREVLGTLRYMAPEQLAGKSVDARTDLYALGLVITEMVPDLGAAPAWLGDLVERLRATDPAARPDSAGDVARALETGSLATAPGGDDAVLATAAHEDIDPEPGTPPVADRDGFDEPTVLIPAVAAATSVPNAEAVRVPEPAPAPAATPSRRVPTRAARDNRPVVVAIVLSGAVLAAVALSGWTGFPASSGGTPAASNAPAVTPPAAQPEEPRGKHKGQGKGG